MRIKCLALTIGALAWAIGAHAAYPDPDLFNARFTSSGLCYDDSPLHLSGSCYEYHNGSRGGVPAAWNPAYGKYTVTLNNGWFKHFSDVNDYVKFDYSNSTDFKNGLNRGHTIECTVRCIDLPSTYDGTAKPFASHQSGGTGIELDNGGFSFSMHNGGGDFHYINSGVFPQINKYYQVVGVWDWYADKLRIYVNGVLKGTVTTSSASTLDLPVSVNGQSSQWFGIGCDPEGSSPTYAGHWEVVSARIWSSALNDAQVKEMYEDNPNVIVDGSLTYSVVHDDEANPTDVKALRTHLRWKAKTNLNSSVSQYAYWVDFTAGNLSKSVYVGNSEAVNGVYAVDYGDLVNGSNVLTCNVQVKASIKPCLNYNNHIYFGAPATLYVTPDYKVYVGDLTAQPYKDASADLWRVDLDFNRASLSTYPEPVSHFTLEYCPDYNSSSSTHTWRTIPNLRLMANGGQMYLTQAEKTAIHDTWAEVFDGRTVPGDYVFGNEPTAAGASDKGYAVKNPGSSESPTVAYYVTDTQPASNTRYRVTAVYGDTNAKARKTYAKTAQLRTSVISTDVSDISVVDAEPQPVRYYDLQGREVAEPAPGVYITSDRRKVVVR